MEQSARLSEFNIQHPYHTNLKSPVLWVLSHAARYWYFALCGVVGAIINGALNGAIPILTGQAFNLINTHEADLNQLIWIATAIAGVQLSRSFIFQLGRNACFEFMAQNIERDIRHELYVNLLGKSMTFHNLQPVGDIMARATNDVREINYFFNPGANMVMGSVVFLFVPVIAAPSYHPSLVIAPIVFIFLYFLALWQYLKTLEPVTDEVRLSFGQLNSRLSEALDGIETVKAASQEASELDLFKKNAFRYRNALVKQGYIEARFLPLLLLSLTYAGGLLHALYLFQLGLINVGGVVAYFGLLTMLDFPTFASMFAYSQMSLGLSSARRILELINTENNMDQNLTGYNQPVKGEIEFRDVCFTYENARPSLCNVSFKIKQGMTVAVVGQTGTGKTTLARLINRTYDTTSGQVLVDGVDVRDWNLETLRRGISIIEQDIFLFSKSIEGNIAFGKPGASPAEVETAAQSAQAHEFIGTFSEKYQTVIGDRGVTLSGGQRQRLAIARAFLTDPPILILDDSTSAIDSATEDHIQRAIFNAAKGRTTFIITHRLSQIRWADLILVLRKGELDAVGTHDELLKTCEPYRRIFNR